METPSSTSSTAKAASCTSTAAATVSSTGKLNAPSHLPLVSIQKTQTLTASSIAGPIGKRQVTFSWYTGTWNYGHMQNHFTATFFEDRPGEVQYKYYDVVQSGMAQAYARVSIGTYLATPAFLHLISLPFPCTSLPASKTKKMSKANNFCAQPTRSPMSKFTRSLPRASSIPSKRAWTTRSLLSCRRTIELSAV